ncbi:phage tail protein [Xenorhabdus innexi]|uniref:Putative E14 prophage tail fiber protein (Modular protein) n=1 Tax=Xenorhabdus innexi TaxID=290109 RepID=A0A1N6MS05_9GAMM|nr:phage tail protein [Xenorhabdus innexi]PHM38601.1 tail protein [Xenorhabdus innexi]SIP71611.1 putative E14 prophage; tail fiber protein (Modular protein) [Xenorhabdus innexi]
MQDKKPESIPSRSEEVIVPTMDDVRKAIKEAIEEHIQTREHPYATLEDKGFVTLSNEVESDSEITVATSRAVKKAFDLANKANSSDKNYVPTNRKVNGKALSSDISLDASDVGTYTKKETDASLANVTKLANTANQNANTRLSKDQNGADIPNRAEFVKNLGLTMQDPAESSLPVGVPVPWPTTTPPKGWLICNGGWFDKARYPQLALAYPSGRLPDLRGEFIRGLDAGRNVDYGRRILSWQNFAIQSHSHNIEINDAGSASSYVGRGNWTRQGSVNTGAFGSNETRPRNIAFLYIVRAA